MYTYNYNVDNFFFFFSFLIYSIILQEIDFVKFMEDPENPLSGSPPPPPSPQEEWASVQGGNLIHHLTETTFDTFINNKEALVMFYAPCKLKLNFIISRRWKCLTN